MNRVAVILVHFHKIEDTRSCVSSILNSTDVSTFIVIVDNSIPNDLQLQVLAEDYENIKIISNEENLGFSKANNLGIKWAQEQGIFDYIFVLNNDTIIETQTIQKLIEPIEKNPSIGISTCKIVYEFDHEIVWYGGAKMDYKKGWPKIVDFESKATNDGANKSKDVEFISGCAMMFSTSSLSLIGEFEPSFFMFCEDLELSLRAQEKGFRLYYTADTTIIHKVGGSHSDQKSGRSKRMHPTNPSIHFLFYHMRSNQYITMRKYLQGSAFFVFFLNYWLRFIYINLLMMVYGRFSIVKTSLKTIKRIVSYKN